MKTYTIGTHKMQLAPLTLDRREKVDEVLRNAGINSLMDLMESTINELIGTLEQKKVLRLFYENVLEFAEPPTDGTTIAQVVGLMEEKECIEVYADFFSGKVGILLKFAASQTNTVSILKEMITPTGQKQPLPS